MKTEKELKAELKKKKWNIYMKQYWKDHPEKKKANYAKQRAKNLIKVQCDVCQKSICRVNLNRHKRNMHPILS
jgi:hypothetical protein